MATRKKSGHYKLVAPLAADAQRKRRQAGLQIILRWVLLCGVAGVLVAFGLIASVFTPLRPGAALWLELWPASLRLLTSSGLDPHQTTHLAFLLAGENGLLYSGFGVPIGAVHVLMREILRRTGQPKRI